MIEKINRETSFEILVTVQIGIPVYVVGVPDVVVDVESDAGDFLPDRLEWYGEYPGAGIDGRERTSDRYVGGLNV